MRRPGNEAIVALVINHLWGGGCGAMTFHQIGELDDGHVLLAMALSP